MSSPEDASLCHKEVIQRVRSILSQLLADQYLNDLPSDILTEEVQYQLAYEQNKTLKITVKKEDNSNIDIIVPEGGTVHDLMKGFQRETVRRMKSDKRSPYVSWKYIWRTYTLTFGNQKLADRQAKLASYGIRKNEQLRIKRK